MLLPEESFIRASSVIQCGSRDLNCPIDIAKPNLSQILLLNSRDLKEKIDSQLLRENVLLKSKQNSH